MATVYDIDPEKLIPAVARDLKEKIKMPDWARIVKTGADKERIPEEEDWWWKRAASLLRRIYLKGPIGVQRLRIHYGSRKNRGVKPEKFYPTGGKILRTILQEFDELGFTEKVKKGRKITVKGRSYLDKIVTNLQKG